MADKHRGIRVSDEVWEAALSRAASEDRTLSQVIREFLRKYAQKED